MEKLVNKFADAAKRFVEGYEQRSKTRSRYVELKAEDTSNQREEPLLEQVAYLINQAFDNNIAILGKFGTGKTSFAYNLIYKKACSWLEDSTRRFPILLRFRYYQPSDSLVDWIINEIMILTGVELSFREFFDLLKEDQIMLILDGLDEIPQSSDKIHFNSVLRELNRLGAMKSPLVITCRTNFFPAVFEEESTLQKFNRLYIQAFGQDQIDSVTRKVFEQPAAFQNSLKKNQIVQELARRPLFLRMLMEVYQEGKELNIANSADLYYQLTSKWLAMESLKDSSLLNTRLKRKLIQEFAFYQFVKGETFIKYDRLGEVIKEVVKGMDASIQKLDPELVMKEIANFGFMDRRLRDHFTFSHQSFREYFIAEKLANELQKGDTSNFAKRALVEEIFEFIGLLLENNGNFHLIGEFLSNPEVFYIARGNMIPMLRKLRKKASIPTLLKVILHEKHPLLRFICGYSIAQFAVEFPSYFHKKEVITALIEGYKREPNSLVRLRIVLLLTEGEYEQTDQYPELDPAYEFDHESVEQLTGVRGFKEAYERIIEVNRENQYTIEEAIRILTLFTTNIDPSFTKRLAKILFTYSIEHQKPRIRRISLWSMGRLGLMRPEHPLLEKSNQILAIAAKDENPNVREMAALAPGLWTAPLSKEEAALQEVLLTPPREEEEFTEEILSNKPIDGASHPNNLNREELEFLDRLETVSRERIGDSRFNLPFLATELAVSERQLHRKVRRLTNLTPNAYVQEIRLQIALELLEKKELSTVSQICYSIGFKNPSYFTQLFFKRFGKKPSSYLA